MKIVRLPYTRILTVLIWLIFFFWALIFDSKLARKGISSLIIFKSLLFSWFLFLFRMYFRCKSGTDSLGNIVLMRSEDNVDRADLGTKEYLFIPVMVSISVPGDEYCSFNSGAFVNVNFTYIAITRHRPFSFNLLSFLFGSVLFKLFYPLPSVLNTPVLFPLLFKPFFIFDIVLCIPSQEYFFTWKLDMI